MDEAGFVYEIKGPESLFQVLLNSFLDSSGLFKLVFFYGHLLFLYVKAFPYGIKAVFLPVQLGIDQLNFTKQAEFFFSTFLEFVEMALNPFVQLFDISLVVFNILRDVRCYCRVRRHGDRCQYQAWKEDVFQNGSAIHNRRNLLVEEKLPHPQSRVEMAIIMMRVGSGKKVG